MYPTQELLPLESEDVEAVSPETENEEDLEELRPEQLSQAVVFATDWTTETILRQLERGNILLNPKYQRRDAWRAKRKSKFIESLILGFPVPQIVLAEARQKKGSYIVIDGKQRLLTIRQFAEKKSPPESDYEPLVLQGLEIRSDLNGCTLLDLENTPDRQEDLLAFQNQTIRTVVLRNWPNESFLYHVFLRLNTGSVQLSPQELRQALHPGRFVTFVIEYSGHSAGLKTILRLKGPDFRMRDVELLVRFYGFQLFRDRYNGNLKEFLDHTCEILNSDWDSWEDLVRQLGKEFEAAIDATIQIFGQKQAFRKYDGQRYEGRFNRAVMDVMLASFTKPEIRTIALSVAGAVEARFRQLCTEDREFLKSIESTTKSIAATHTRFERWQKALEECLHRPKDRLVEI